MLITLKVKQNIPDIPFELITQEGVTAGIIVALFLFGIIYYVTKSAKWSVTFALIFGVAVSIAVSNNPIA